MSSSKFALLSLLAIQPALVFANVCHGPEFPVTMDGVITFQARETDGHVEYRINFPKSLDGKSFRSAYLTVGNEETSWLRTELQVAHSNGPKGNLLAILEANSNTFPISVYATYSGACVIVTSKVIRQ